MGNMKTLLIFGFERWGNLKPACMYQENKCYKPLFLGLWIKCKDKKGVE